MKNRQFNSGTKTGWLILGTLAALICITFWLGILIFTRHEANVLQNFSFTTIEVYLAILPTIMAVCLVVFTEYFDRKSSTKKIVTKWQRRSIYFLTVLLLGFLFSVSATSLLALSKTLPY